MFITSDKLAHKRKNTRTNALTYITSTRALWHVRCTIQLCGHVNFNITLNNRTLQVFLPLPRWWFFFSSNFFAFCLFIQPFAPCHVSMVCVWVTPQALSSQSALVLTNGLVPRVTFVSFSYVRVMCVFVCGCVRVCMYNILSPYRLRHWLV